MRIRLALSFDHELSLGGTSSFRHNLFEPTDRLLRLADELGVRVVLFTDILCALRYREWDREGFFEPYCRQLESAVTRGHDVQLHIHPHWIDSRYENGAYRPSSSFALADFASTPPPNDIDGIIGQAFELLVTLCSRADPEYTCVAYRAGGYNLAPQTQTILTSLFKRGIRFDSSIIKGYRFSSGLSRVDFSRMPETANWTLPPGLYEIPIASRPRTPFNNLPFLIRRILNRRYAHDARGYSIHADHTSPLQKIGRVFPRSAWTLSFDDAAHTPADLMRIFRSHVRAHRTEDQIVCATVSHPKNMGSYEFWLMTKFVDRVRREFGSDVEFCTFKDLYGSSTYPVSAGTVEGIAAPVIETVPPSSTSS